MKSIDMEPRSWLLALVAALCFSSCIYPGGDQYEEDGEYARPLFGPDLEPQQTIASAQLGVTFYDTLERSGGENPLSSGSGSLDAVPAIGATWAQVFGSARVDWGLEGGGTMGYRTGNGAVESDLGGGQVDVDLDLFAFDVYGGAFVSTPVGDRVRLYASAGPAVQIASFSQEGFDSTAMEEISQSGSGLGLGYYARGGIEFFTAGQLAMGLTLRWIDTQTSIDENLGRLDLSGLQVFFTLSNGN
jgi:hypothetical protein